MEDGLLSLKWNNHKSTFFHILSSLRKKETYTDATLACDGKFFPVHRLVMSTCSDYFGEVFERTTCKSPVVILKDIKHNDLEALLDYMYLGEVDVKQSELAGLIKAAECLRIKGLAVPDEDPSQSHRKHTLVPEYRSSPSPKRTRRDSGSSDTMCRYSSSHKSQRPLSPSNSSTRSHATSVPSQTSESLSSSVPVQSSPHMMPPPSSYGDMAHHPSDNIQKQSIDQSIVPVEMIKVEVEDEGNNNNSHLRPSQDGSSSSGDGGGGRRDDTREGGGIGDSSSAGGGRGKDSLSNSYSEYSGHEVEKVEEQDQLDAYNGSDQLPGPSGVQGAPQMMNWGDEEGNFPHNLFGGEDSNQQQVGWQVPGLEELSKWAALTFLSQQEGSPARNNVRKFQFTNNIDQNGESDSYTREEDFEGFQSETIKVSEQKCKLLDSKMENLLDNCVQSSDSESESSTPIASCKEFQEYTPFEVLAKEFEDELSLIPCEVSIEEDDVTYIPQTQPKRRKTYFCYKCSSCFKTKKKLDEHLEDNDVCGYFCCPVCPYKGQDILNHSEFHSERNADGVLSCVLCKMPVYSLDNLVNHLKLKHMY